MRIAIFEESDNIRGGLVKGSKIRAFDLEIGALGVASIDDGFLENPVFVGKNREKQDFAPVYSINNVFLYDLFINSNSL